MSRIRNLINCISSRLRANVAALAVGAVGGSDLFGALSREAIDVGAEGGRLAAMRADSTNKFLLRGLHSGTDTVRAATALVCGSETRRAFQILTALDIGARTTTIFHDHSIHEHIDRGDGGDKEERRQFHHHFEFVLVGFNLFGKKEF